MKWIVDNCKYGDIIRVRLGALYHYGIYVSDDEVIQFGLPPISRNLFDPVGIAVCATDIDTFACGNFVEVAQLDKEERKKRFSPDKTVRTAQGRLGEGGYNVLHNNCEHFVNECCFGVHRSEQEEAMRRKWLERPVLDVYISEVLQDYSVVLTPVERQQEVDCVTNENLKRQKVSTWTLLQTALKHSFGYELGEAEFTRQKNGKWLCDKAWFSLSHTDDYAIVAVSNAAVGVDAENKQSFADRWKDEHARNAFARKITAKGEARDVGDLLALWIKKESAYKLSGKGGFNPSGINTDLTSYALREYDGVAIAVCGANLSAVRFFKVEGQSVKPIALGSL